MRLLIRLVLLVGAAVIAACSSVTHKAVPTSSSRLLSADGAGGCTLQKGSTSETLLVGSVVLDKEHVETRGLLLSGGHIREIGDAAELQQQHSDADLIRCEHAFISPGLINAHEHTAYSFLFPDPKMSPVYVHRDEWREGLNGKPKLAYHDTKDPSVLAWIELRHLVHGVTTVAGSGGVAGIVKNVSSPASEVYVYVADMQTFPFGMAVENTFGNAACDSDASKLGIPKKSTSAPDTAPYVPHVGEGTNCAAKLELNDYLAYVASNSGRKYSLIHGVALDKTHLQAIQDNNVSVIWSPRSNLALYGKTLDPTWLLDAGVSVGLGTDWSLSGSFNMLEEMSCAKAVSAAKGRRQVNGRELWEMATTAAARAIGVDNLTGSIEVGKEADLVVINDPAGLGIDRFGSLDQSDVIAVFVDGALLAGDVEKFGNRPVGSCTNEVDGKFVCVDFSQYQFTFDQMKAANAQNVDLVETSKQAKCKF